MATYLVGDLHGCLSELNTLLEQAQFDPIKDTLWLTGDLIARGPESLETLRFIHSLGDSARTVLGNHDLHLLATAEGFARIKEKDKITSILASSDGKYLLEWLRHQPLLQEHDEFVVAHAGLSPDWDLSTARQCNHEIIQRLQSTHYRDLLQGMYGDGPERWSETLKGLDRQRYIINAFTRMRFCTQEGALDMHCKLPPNDPQIDNLLPWFSLPNKGWQKTVIFGHWASLMGHEDEHCIGLDTGCVWGEYLTLLRWEDKTRFVSQALPSSVAK
jgi:bis(5'-nucleosyl)-tetraphosphatase (symmetrical)